MGDDFHTTDELYLHRAALLAALCKSNPGLFWRSRKHHDGTMYDGDWFIAGAKLPGAGDITYHVEGRFWDAFSAARTVEFAPPWDGHTSDQVAARLFAWNGTTRAIAPPLQR